MSVPKKNQLVGLDIGSHSVKLVEIDDSKKGLILKNFGIIGLPQNAIVEGSVKEMEIVSAAIKNLYKNLKIKNKNVATSISGYSVIVKKISIDQREESELESTIHEEAEQYIPFDISDVNLDFQILGESESNPNQMNVFLVAAKKAMLDDYINMMNLAGLNPCIFDVESFALQNSFEASYDAQNQDVALIDIGASKTSLNILKNAASVFMRDVSLGCGQINQKIMSLIECSFEEAEQLKYGNTPDKLSPDDLKGIVSSVVADWCTEIRRALDFFYSTYPEDRIKRIILSGGGANIGEFRDLLATEASADVEMINPFQNFFIENKKLDEAFIKQVAPQAAICMGLAMRKVDDK